MKLTTEQTDAVRLALSGAPLACLTGGPGVGKTTTVRGVLDAAAQAGVRVALASPTGKAAQRLEEATGREAFTLHRLLGIIPGGDEGATRDVEADLLVVDEASMIDSRLMAAAVTSAAAAGARLLLVGDADQLPPVGPGQPFHDLIAAKRCPAVRLTEVHRQAAESGIILAAHAIRQGTAPEWTDDFRLVPCEDLADVPAAVWGVVTGEGLAPHTSQILAPQHNTPGGVDALNAYVESHRRAITDAEPLVRGFRAGTKAIHKKNNYDMGVFNGDVGEVVQADKGHKVVDGKRELVPGKDALRVAIGSGGDKIYRGAMIRDLRPAWALTVHASQGSEYDDVVVVVHRSHSFMLSRRLLYVAVTRAAKRVWIVGQAAAVQRAVRNVRDAKRDTWLGQRFARDAARTA